MFANRRDAGVQLARELKKYKNNPDAIVIALPRGGIIPGHIIAKELNLPLDVALVKKLGHPSNPEYAIGAVSMNDFILDGDPTISSDYVSKEVEKIQKMLAERYKRYYHNMKPIGLTNKLVIIVDDGVATGKTLLAAVKLIKKEKPKQIIVAVPVGAESTIERIKEVVDEVVCLAIHDPFYAIGRYYENFEQVDDETVVELLRQSARVPSE